MNVVDSLVVELGLNSKQFVEGIRGATESLAGFAMKTLALAGVVTSIEGIVNYFKDLEGHLADVGYQARNLGVSSAQMSRFGEVAQLMGGQAADAINSVEGLQGAIFNLQYRGQMSDQLAMMQRFGVAYLTASGHMRDFKDLAFDAAAAVDRQKASGMNQGEALQLSMSMGFTGGVAAAIADGGEGLQKALDEASKDQKGISDRTIDAARRIDQAFTRMSNVIAAQLAPVLEKLAPEIIEFTGWVRQFASDVMPKIPKAIDDFKDFLHNPPEWLKELEGDFQEFKKILHDPPPWLQMIEKYLGAKSDTTQTGDQGAASPTSGLSGTIAAAIVASLGWGKLALGMGGKAVPFVGTAWTIADLLEHFLPAGGAKWFSDTSLIPGWEPFGTGNSSWDAFGKLFDMTNFTAFPGLSSPAPAPSAPMMVPPAPPTPNAPRPAASGGSVAHPTAMNGGGSTSVQIDSITINTRATDAYAMASDVNGALARKLFVANADSGIA